jgi:D-glycero-D-manno-heptose 1,7-bisphosphate phosphatase
MNSGEIMKRRAVFLDRDGVINRAIVRNGKPYAPANLSELEVLPDVPEALSLLKNADYLLIVVTNQPDVARGIISREVVESINGKLASCLPIDEFRVCYHDSGDGCFCRKPLPGALLLAAEQHGIDLAASFMIGDRWRDMEAGQRAGCQTIFIDYGYAEKQPSMVDYRISTLLGAANIILCNGVP